MIELIKFDDIVKMMESCDGRDRVVAEYIRLKQWYESIKAFNNKVEAGKYFERPVITPDTKIPYELSRELQSNIGHLLHTIEVAAVIEDIDLEDVINFYIGKALRTESECRSVADCKCKTTEKMECNANAAEIDLYKKAIEHEKEHPECYGRLEHADLIHDNGEDTENEERCDGDVCENEVAKPADELPDDVMSLEDTIRGIECLQKCRDQPDCLMEACPWFSNEKEACCEDSLKTEVSCLYHLKKYAEHK